MTAKIPKTIHLLRPTIRGETRSHSFKESFTSPADSIVKQIEEVIGAEDSRSVLAIPKGSTPDEVVRALGWFTARGGIIEDLGACQVLDGGKELKLGVELRPALNEPQVAQIVGHYRLLSPHYQDWESIFLKPSATKSFSLMAMILESQAQLIEAVYEMLPALKNRKRAGELKKNLSPIPEWLLRIISLHKEYDGDNG